MFTLFSTIVYVSTIINVYFCHFINRWSLLKTVKSRQQQDGINSLNYTVLELEKKTLFTWILISVNQTELIQQSKETEKLASVAKSANNKPAAQHPVKVQFPDNKGNFSISIQALPLPAENQQVVAEQPKPRSVRTKLQNPKMVSWLPTGFNGTVPDNLTVFQPLPIKTPSAAELKRRQAHAALRAKNQKSVTSKNQVAVSNDEPPPPIVPKTALQQQQQQQQEIVRQQQQQQQQQQTLDIVQERIQENIQQVQQQLNQQQQQLTHVKAQSIVTQYPQQEISSDQQLEANILQQLQQQEQYSPQQ